MTLLATLLALLTVTLLAWKAKAGPAQTVLPVPVRRDRSPLPRRDA